MLIKTCPNLVKVADKSFAYIVGFTTLLHKCSDSSDLWMIIIQVFSWSRIGMTLQADSIAQSGCCHPLCGKLWLRSQTYIYNAQGFVYTLKEREKIYIHTYLLRLITVIFYLLNFPPYTIRIKNSMYYVYMLYIYILEINKNKAFATQTLQCSWCSQDGNSFQLIQRVFECVHCML